MSVHKFEPKGDLSKFFNDPDATDLLRFYVQSPYRSEKKLDYFPTYANLLKEYRGQRCTLIEIGVKDGGSLFMWKEWLGERARIIGIDINPVVKQFENDGFEIYIGDQADEDFLKKCFNEIGSYDILIDDGGHKLHQQLVTIQVALMFLNKKASILVEDTEVSFRKSFQKNQEKSFLDFAKDVGDLLTARDIFFLEDGDERKKEFPNTINKKAIKFFSAVQSVQFYPGIVNFQCDPFLKSFCKTTLNNTNTAVNIHDYRDKGINSIIVNWPYAFKKEEKRISFTENTFPKKD